MLNKKQLQTGLLTTVLVIGLSGCAFGNSKTIITPSLGKEMIDLKEALDEGAISQQEYEEAKILVKKRNALQKDD